jgi:hypothetical protein
MRIKPLRLAPPYRLRLLLRAAFGFLMLATVGLALSVLQQEKQLSYKNYQANFHKTREQVSATLRHPAGQLALLNPPGRQTGGAGLRPLLLPFAGLDFDDQQKVQQAMAMSGCPCGCQLGCRRTLYLTATVRAGRRRIWIRSRSLSTCWRQVTVSRS